jgi:uncharacterized protein YwgA
MNKWGPGGDPQLMCGPYSHQLTDEYSPLTNKYKSFIFLQLPILAAFLNGEPSKQAEYTRYIIHNTNITHIIKSTSKFMTSKSKTSSTTLRQYSSQQAKQKPKLRQLKAKQLLCHRVIATGSSYWVEEAVDEVISWPAALL